MRVVKSVFRGITFLISELKAGTAILHGNGGEAINRLLKGTRAFRQRADGDQVESGTRTERIASSQSILVRHAMVCALSAARWAAALASVEGVIFATTGRLWEPSRTIRHSALGPRFEKLCVIVSQKFKGHFRPSGRTTVTTGGRPSQGPEGEAGNASAVLG